jgi:hypothetical protein
LARLDLCQVVPYFSRTISKERQGVLSSLKGLANNGRTQPRFVPAPFTLGESSACNQSPHTMRIGLASGTISARLAALARFDVAGRGGWCL